MKILHVLSSVSSKTTVQTSPCKDRPNTSSIYLDTIQNFLTVASDTQSFDGLRNTLDHHVNGKGRFPFPLMLIKLRILVMKYNFPGCELNQNTNNYRSIFCFSSFCGSIMKYFDLI